MVSNFIKKIFVIVIFASVLMIGGFFIVVDYYNKESAKDNATAILDMLEKEIIIYNGNFREFVKVGNRENIRITVIDLDGNVLADTSRDNIDEKPFDNHSNRKEFIASLKSGGPSYSLRFSESDGVHYLYTADKIKTNFDDVILRVAIPIESINKYFISFIITTIVIIIFVMIIISLVLPFAVKDFISPYIMIKQNLDSILTGNTILKKTITKFDEVNVVLDEINTLSTRLNANNISFKREQDKLSYVLENILEGVIALDKNKNIVFINSLAFELIDNKIKNPKHIIELIRDNDILKKIDNVYVMKEYITFDMTRNGLVIEFSIFPVYGLDIDILIKLSNVTEIRKLSKEKQDFFTNASHELNTPLTSIIGYTELLLNDGKKKDNDFIDRIYNSANKMKDLISDMLTLSKAVSSYNEELLEVIDLSDIVKEVIDSLRIKAKEKNISILESIEYVNIEAERRKIYDVVSNIIENAIKYSKENGEIKVFVSEENKRAVFRVVDNGIGIPKEHLSRVFERFFRSNNVGSVSGTGLGLAIVRNICNHYNANITLKSDVNKQTEFSISFIKK